MRQQRRRRREPECQSLRQKRQPSVEDVKSCKNEESNAIQSHQDAALEQLPIRESNHLRTDSCAFQQFTRSPPFTLTNDVFTNCCHTFAIGSRVITRHHSERMNGRETETDRQPDWREAVGVEVATDDRQQGTSDVPLSLSLSHSHAASQQSVIMRSSDGKLFL